METPGTHQINLIKLKSNQIETMSQSRQIKSETIFQYSDYSFSINWIQLNELFILLCSCCIARNVVTKRDVLFVLYLT